MTPKAIAALLILSLFAFATAGANPASAQGSGFRGGGHNGGGGSNFHGGKPNGGGFHGRGFHGRGLHGRGFHGRGFHGPSIGVSGFVDGYGNGYNGYNDWYGISSGHDECPLFRQRVMTPNGWSFRMIPIC